MTQIILAYDLSVFEARQKSLLHNILTEVGLIKLGLETITAGGQTGPTLADRIRTFTVSLHNAPKVMWDAKLADIENTVRKAARNIVEREGVGMLTIMASVSSGALRAGADTCQKAGVLALGVTVLTDINEECESIFGDTPSNKVLQFALRAKECGLGGIVCSPQELRFLRERGVTGLSFVTPGIRPKGTDSGDQKRVMTPGEAAKLGADYIVVGRPIMEAPDPFMAARRIREEANG